MLVDFSTTEKNLEDLMLAEYPGKIFEDQIKKVGEGKKKTYYFLSLDYEELSKFLTTLSNKDYKFKILEHKTKRLIESNSDFNKLSH